MKIRDKYKLTNLFLVISSIRWATPVERRESDTNDGADCC